MMKIKRLSLIVNFCIVLNSCQEGASYKELGNNITFDRGAGQSINGGTWENDLTIFPEVKSYDFDENYIVIIQIPDYKGYISELSEMVLALRFSSYESFLQDRSYYKNLDSNSNIFTLSVIKGDSIIYSILKSKNFTFNYQETDWKISESVADSIIRNDPYHKKIFSQKINYWIIDKGKMKLLGPFTKEEFYQKRKKLGVSEELEFDEGEYN